MKRFAPLTDLGLIHEILPKISFFGGLSEEQLDEILKRFEVSAFEKDEQIGCPGEVPSHVHIIHEGCVDLLISLSGSLVKKRQFGVGDCFGEAALLSLINNTATFVAAENTRLLSLSRRQLQLLHSEEPDVFLQLVINMARDLARKLQFTDEMLLRLQQ